MYTYRIPTDLQFLANGNRGHYQAEVTADSINGGEVKITLYKFFMVVGGDSSLDIF